MATKTKKPLTEKQRKIRVLITALIVCVVLVAGSITAALCYSNYLGTGGPQRKLISFESKNYEVNNCMMTYYFLSDFYNLYNEQGYYLSMYGLDPQADLTTQYYDQTNGQTWFDYFLNQSAGMVQRYLEYAEAGKDAGFVYKDLDSRIDTAITALKDDAKSRNLSFDDYLKNIYTTVVKESDIRDALELQIYANEYYAKIEADAKAALTEDSFTKYKNENPNTVNKVDYLSYTVSSTAASDATDEVKAEKKAEAESNATSLYNEAAKGEAEFNTWVTNYMTKLNSEKETPSSEEDLATEISSALSAKLEQNYSESDEFLKWAYEEGRAAGDVKRVDDAENGKYTIYILKATPYLPDYNTRNIRHILIKSDSYETDEEVLAKAEEVLAEWQAGEATAESFETVAKEHNEDSNCLYENVKKGQMVKAFNDWLFDDARKEGDSGIVKTEYGYHVMLYGGEGVNSWKSAAETALVSEATTAFTEQCSAKYESAITITAENLYQITTTIPATALASSTAA